MTPKRPIGHRRKKTLPELVETEVVDMEPTIRVELTTDVHPPKTDHLEYRWPFAEVKVKCKSTAVVLPVDSVKSHLI